MNRNTNETESFAGNFVASDEYGLFFEVPSCNTRNYGQPTVRANTMLHTFCKDTLSSPM